MFCCRFQVVEIKTKIGFGERVDASWCTLIPFFFYFFEWMEISAERSTKKEKRKKKTTRKMKLIRITYYNNKESISIAVNRGIIKMVVCCTHKVFTSLHILVRINCSGFSLQEFGYMYQRKQLKTHTKQPKNQFSSYIFCVSASHRAAQSKTETDTRNINRFDKHL